MNVEIIRSERRTRTSSARLVGSTIEVRVPAGLNAQTERDIVARLVKRIEERKARRELNHERDLQQRAMELNHRYFDGKLTWQSIAWVTNQADRYGSCSTQAGSIRIAHTLAAMPLWVLDYVIVHELAHLLRPDHSPAFWKLVGRYKLTERARGYLMGRGVATATDGEVDDI